MIAAAIENLEMEEIQENVKQIVNKLENKLGKAEFNESLQSIKDTFDRVQKDSMLKANIKDVISIVDTKSSKQKMMQKIKKIR